MNKKCLVILLHNLFVCIASYVVTVEIPKLTS